MRCFVSFLISMVTVFGLTLQVEESPAGLDPRSFFLLPPFLLITYGLYTIFGSTNQRLKLFSAIPALLLAFCHLFGRLLADKQTVLWLLKDSRTAITGGLIFFSVLILLYCMIFFCFRLLSKDRPASDSLTGMSFGILWILMAAAWLPWLLNQFPAVMTADSTDQIEMAIGVEPLTNHHPVLYTYLLRAALKLGKLISGTDSGNQTGIAVFSILQFLGMSAAYAAVLRMILKSSASDVVKTGAFLYFMLYPVHPLYSVTIWKDVPFAVCVLLLTAFLSCELKKHRLLNCSGIAVSGLLLCLFRHNGIFLIILTLPFLPFAFKNYIKQVITAFLCIILLFFGWQGLLALSQIPKGQSSEALSIPLQQIALTARRQHDTMEDRVIEELNTWFTEENIWERYHYRISDPVKNLFNEDLYRSDSARFWKFWLKLGMLYPQDYLDGILLHTFGYWYPETPHWVFITGIDDDGIFGIHMDPKLNTEWANSAVRWLSNSGYDQIPIFSLAFSPGACFWFFLIVLFYCLYRKSPVFILCIPSFVLWLTALASPVNCEYRYVYAMFACFPLILAILPTGKTSE